MQTEAEGAGDWSRAVPLLMELRDVLKTCAAGGSAADATVFNPLIGECEERLTNARRRLVQPLPPPRPASKPTSAIAAPRRPPLPRATRPRARPR